MGRGEPRLLLLAGLMISGLANAPALPALAEEIFVVPDGIPPVEVRIISTEFKYAPANVRVRAGHVVTLILDNSGGETEHGVIVPAFGFRLEAKAGEVVRTTIVFDRPGEYEFTCDLPGHREAGMKGKLIVAGL